MRELKFRAWHKQDQKMYRVVTLIMGRVAQSVTIATSDSIFSFVTYPFDEVEWMQYTGLKDKHGNEIWEGDIVKADYHWDGPHAIVWPDDYYHLIEFGLIDTDAYLEVIGNKYENSDLLKEGQ